MVDTLFDKMTLPINKDFTPVNIVYNRGIDLGIVNNITITKSNGNIPSRELTNEEVDTMILALEDYTVYLFS